MNYRRYISIVGVVTIVVSIALLIVFWPNFTYSVGIIWGALASMLGFWSIHSTVENMPLRDLSDTKRDLRRGKMMRYAIYGVFVMIAVFIPELVSILSTITMLIVVKLLLVISEMTRLKRP